jgi:hypothetical protein
MELILRKQEDRQKEKEKKSIIENGVRVIIALTTRKQG